MKLWRVSRYVDLEGKGGLYAAGRWHSKGQPVIYTSEHAALAIIEFLVNVGDRKLIPEDTTLYAIHVPQNAASRRVDMEALPANWRWRPDLTRSLGDRWLEEGAELTLAVPAATTKGTNILINPQHPHMSMLSIVERITSPFDARLLDLK